MLFPVLAHEFIFNLPLDSCVILPDWTVEEVRCLEFLVPTWRSRYLYRVPLPGRYLYRVPLTFPKETVLHIDLLLLRSTKILKNIE